MSGFYIFLSSEDGKTKFSENKFDSFVVELTPAITLACTPYHSDWTFALTEISLTNSSHSLIPEPCVVLCDLAQSSYINDTHASVLRTFGSDVDKVGSLYHSYYIGLNSTYFNRITISLKNYDLKPLDSKLWDQQTITKLVLHFQRM